MNIRIARLLFFFLIVTIVLSTTACSLVKKRIKPIDITASQTCSVPCWQGITPGVTTIDEAWMIAQDLSSSKTDNNLVPTSIKKDDDNRDIHIFFEERSVWIKSDVDGVIEEIQFSFGYKKLRKPRLMDIIAQYGEPESIEICHEAFEMRRAIVFVYYPNMYMMFDKFLPIEGDSFKVPIEGSSRIEYILYIPTSTERPIYDFSFPWSGFTDLIIAPVERSPESICVKLFPYSTP